MMGTREVELDILKEVGTIGGGNAATALSSLLKTPVQISVPLVQMVPFPELLEAAGGEEKVAAVTFLRIAGHISGSIFFVLEPEEMQTVGRALVESWNISRTPENEQDLFASALCELTNILAGSYLSALSDFTGLYMMPTVPSSAVDMIGALLSEGLIEAGLEGDEAIMIDTNMTKGEHQSQMAGRFFMLPDAHSLPKIFASLGVQESGA
ncbi:hypothetical protein CHL76_03630 [Marinococcus halophilus]|nr:hypothetical protein CHL76_03630 [Marinococcus halophilus]